MELYQVNNGKLRVTLHPGQTEAWESSARMTFVIAGTQGGKTSMTPIWLHRETKETGPGDYLAVTATYDLFKLKFLPEMRRYFEMFGWQYSAAERVLTQEYKPRMFSRIILRSANAPGGLESATAKAAVLDECGQDEFRLESWEAVLRRLSLAQGRVLGATTPYNMGWLKTEVYDRWRNGDADYRVIQFKSIMNPAFPREEYERAKRTLPAWKFEMFYNGEFTRPAGLIYGDFTEANKIAPFAIPDTWPRFLGVDFGAVHTAKLWAAQDPKSGFLYIYREALDGDQTTAQHVKGVLAHERLQGAWGGAASEKQQRWDWGAAGLSVREPGVIDVEAGIDRVIAGFKEKRLYIFNSLPGLLDELGTYARELDEAGQPTEKIKNKNDFHRIDALRYLVCGVAGNATKISLSATVTNYAR